MTVCEPGSIKRLIVEGNIGAGKTTFLKMLDRAMEVQVVYEPHEKWQHVMGEQNLLDMFYTDPGRWAYTFQTYAFVTRVMEIEAHAQKSFSPLHILERSVFSDRFCFAKMQYELGNISALEWKLYQEWFVWLVESYTPQPDGFIYLKTDPHVCYERMRKRNRSEEVGVSLEYLQSLHDKHEEWLVDNRETIPFIQNVPVLVLNCDIDFEESEEEQKKHVARIREFFGFDEGYSAGKQSVATLHLS